MQLPHEGGGANRRSRLSLRSRSRGLRPSPREDVGRAPAAAELRREVANLEKLAHYRGTTKSGGLATSARFTISICSPHGVTK